MEKIDKDIFDILIEEINKSISSGNYLSVLVLILILPDICASIDSNKEKTTYLDYQGWLEKYTCYKNNERTLNSKTVWEIRNKLLHKGRFLSKNSNDKVGGKKGREVDYEVYFALPSNIRITSNNGSVPIGAGGNRYLQIIIEDFVKNILDGFINWKEEVNGTENYKNYIKKAIKLGVPNLGEGVTWNLPTLY